MLASRLWNSLLFCSLYLSFFMFFFCTAFYHFNLLLLTFITGFCLGIPCSSISHFVETSYLTFIEFNWLVASWCEIWAWGFSKQIKNSFTCGYMCVYIYMYLYVYACKCDICYMYVCVCVCVFVYIHVYMYICVCVYVCTCMYVYMYILLLLFNS